MIADTRCELQAQEVKQSKYHLREARRIRRVLNDGELGFIIEDFVEDIRRIPYGRRDDLGAVLGELI
jgi:hypothetical protein